MSNVYSTDKNKMIENIMELSTYSQRFGTTMMILSRERKNVKFNVVQNEVDLVSETLQLIKELRNRVLKDNEVWRYMYKVKVKAIRLFKSDKPLGGIRIKYDIYNKNGILCEHGYVGLFHFIKMLFCTKILKKCTPTFWGGQRIWEK